jgi:hypothetical protein
MVTTQNFLITYLTPILIFFDIGNLCDLKFFLKMTYPTII